MLFSCRAASLRRVRSTRTEAAVRGRRSRLSYSRFLATKKRGLMLGHTPNGPSRKICRWKPDRHHRVFEHRAEPAVPPCTRWTQCCTSSVQSESLDILPENWCRFTPTKSA